LDLGSCIKVYEISGFAWSFARFDILINNDIYITVKIHLKTK